MSPLKSVFDHRKMAHLPSGEAVNRDAFRHL